MSVYRCVLEWLKQHLLNCPVKHLTHIDCPGCGMQRSIIALLEGDLAKSLSYYPATIPIFALLIFTALHLKFDFKSGAEIIKWGFIGCMVLVVGFYIYKIVTHKFI
jgi:hypothetical protein